jgi:hypothetical protein
MGEVESHEPEVVDELAFRALRANSHHREVGRHLGYAMDHAIACGEELEAAFQRLPHGEWESWLAENFEGGRSTAYEYRRFARNKAELNVHGHGHLSLAEARRILSPPKDEDEDEPPALAAEKQEPRAGRGDEDEPERDEAKALIEQQRKLDEKAEALALRQQELDAEAAAMEERARKIEADFTEALADLQAKYGEAEPPDFVDVPDEVWEEAFENAKSARVINAGRSLRHYMGMSTALGEYLVIELAEAVREMPHNEPFVDNFRFVHERMGEVIEVLDLIEQTEK